MSHRRRTSARTRKVSHAIEMLEVRRLFSAPGAEWQLTFADDFDGAALDASKWSMYLPWSNSVSGDNRHHSTEGRYLNYMMPDDVAVGGGNLTLNTRRRDVTSPSGHVFNYTGAMLTTNATFWTQYGYAEIRSKLPTGPGNWPAFWALSNGWPPESDIMEAWTTPANLHQGLYDMAGTWHSTWTGTPAADTWHTYGLEWGPGYQKFSFDGVVTNTVNSGNVPSSSMYLLLNSGIQNGHTTNYSNANNNALAVDYVHVYGYTPTPGPKLVNGGFDAPGGYALAGGAYVVDGATIGRSGSGDLHIDGPGEASQLVTGLSPNTTYTLSGQGAIGAGAKQGRLGVRGHGGAEVTAAVGGTGGAWAPGAVTFKTGPNNTSAVLFASNPGTFAASEKVYYDDLLLARAPVLAPIADTGAVTGVGKSVAINVAPGSSGGFWKATATSSNQALVKNAGFAFTGGGNGRTLVVTPEANQSGTTTVTVTVTDSFGARAIDTFTLTVAPTLLTATAGNFVSLKWTPVQGATGYNVTRAASQAGAYAPVASGLASTAYTDTSVAPGTTYWYVVTAVKSGGNVSSNAVSAAPKLATRRSHLKFDESTGTTATDASGSGYAGTLVNGPTFAAGTLGNAVTLDGANDYVALPTGVVNGLTSVAIAAWVNLSNGNPWQRIFDFGTGQSAYMFLTPRSAGDNVLKFAITTGGGAGEQQIKGTSALPTGAWTHVAVTLAGSVGILYVNGVEVGRNENMTLSPAALGSTTQNWIGRSQYADPYLGGKVDDFRIYNNALSAAEVSALASKLATPGAPTGLTATAQDAAVALKWTLTGGATSYNVKRATAAGGPFATVARVMGTGFTDTGRANGTTYFYVVSAVNAAGEGGNSGQVSAKPGAPSIAAPSNLAASVISTTQINLAWKDNSTVETGYVLDRATNNAFTSGLVTTTLAANTTARGVTGLSANTTYYFRVRAVSGAVNSANSNVVTARTKAAPVTYQAEAGTLGGGALVKTDHAGYTGSGFVDLPTANGYTQASVNAAAAGAHTITFRYALLTGTRNVQLKLNGAIVTGGVTFTSSGSWATWKTVVVQVNLIAGANTIRLTSIGQDSANLDSLVVTPV